MTAQLTTLPHTPPFARASGPLGGTGAINSDGRGMWHATGPQARQISTLNTEILFWEILLCNIYIYIIYGSFSFVFLWTNRVRAPCLHFPYDKIGVGAIVVIFLNAKHGFGLIVVSFLPYEKKQGFRGKETYEKRLYTWLFFEGLRNSCFFFLGLYLCQVRSVAWTADDSMLVPGRRCQLMSVWHGLSDNMSKCTYVPRPRIK